MSDFELELRQPYDNDRSLELLLKIIRERTGLTAAEVLRRIADYMDANEISDFMSVVRKVHVEVLL